MLVESILVWLHYTSYYKIQAYFKQKFHTCKMLSPLLPTPSPPLPSPLYLPHCAMRCTFDKCTLKNLALCTWLKYQKILFYNYPLTLMHLFYKNLLFLRCILYNFLYNIYVHLILFHCRIFSFLIRISFLTISLQCLFLDPYVSIFFCFFTSLSLYILGHMTYEYGVPYVQ